MKFQNCPVVSRAVPVRARLAASSDATKKLHDRCLELLKQVREDKVSACRSAIPTGTYMLDKLNDVVPDRVLDDTVTGNIAA